MLSKLLRFLLTGSAVQQFVQTKYLGCTIVMHGTQKALWSSQQVLLHEIGLYVKDQYKIVTLWSDKRNKQILSRPEHLEIAYEGTDG